MQYVLKQKIASLGINFTIKDVKGQAAFQVKGELFSIGDKLSVQDLEGNELVYIEQQSFNRYDLWRDGCKVGWGNQHWTAWRRLGARHLRDARSRAGASAKSFHRQKSFRLAGRRAGTGFSRARTQSIPRSQRKAPQPPRAGRASDHQ